MSLHASALALAFLLVPTIAEAADAAPEWQIRTEMNGHSCRAILLDKVVDTQIVRNNDDKLVIVPGHPNWNPPIGETDLMLQVDDRPAIHFEGTALGRSVFILVEDSAASDAIKKAKTLRWHFAWGDYVATVTGLGETFDKLGKC